MAMLVWPSANLVAFELTRRAPGPLQQMDDNGYIPLGVVANFNRVRMLTPDLGLIVEALHGSDIVELSKSTEFVRVKKDHEKWVLPPQQRDLAHKPRAPITAEEEDSKAPREGDGEDDGNEDEDMFQLDEEHEDDDDDEEVDEEEEEEEKDELDARDVAKLIIVTQSRSRRPRDSHMDRDAEHAIKDGLRAYEQHLRHDRPEGNRQRSRQREQGWPPRHHKVDILPFSQPAPGAVTPPHTRWPDHPHLNVNKGRHECQHSC